jgi:hypothetical protein
MWERFRDDEIQHFLFSLCVGPSKVGGPQGSSTNRKSSLEICVRFADLP